MKRRMIVLLFVVVGMLVPEAARVLAQSSCNCVGIRLVEIPSDRASDPRAHLYIIDHVAPGASLNRRIEVSNGTAQTLTIQLYAAGASVNNGSFVFADGRKQNELSSWTTVTPTHVTIASGQTARAEVSIAVPANASAGERYAVVWAQLPASRPSSGGVSAVNRVGIRVYLSVGAGGEPPSDFAIVSLRGERTAKGRPEVAALVKNTGGRALDLSGQLTLDNGPSSLKAGPFPAELGTTLGVGASEEVHVLLDPQIPAGPWLAHLTLKSGLLIRSARATITFPAAAGAVGPAVPAKPDRARAFLLPVSGGLVLLLLIALGWFLLWKRRRDEEERQAKA
jgi:hypothetical protein